MKLSDLFQNKASKESHARQRTRQEQNQKPKTKEVTYLDTQTNTTRRVNVPKHMRIINNISDLSDTSSSGFSSSGKHKKEVTYFDVDSNTTRHANVPRHMRIIRDLSDLSSDTLEPSSDTAQVTYFDVNTDTSKDTMSTTDSRRSHTDASDASDASDESYASYSEFSPKTGQDTDSTTLDSIFDSYLYDDDSEYYRDSFSSSTDTASSDIGISSSNSDTLSAQNIIKRQN
jgi:hypothetical protein